MTQNQRKGILTCVAGFLKEKKVQKLTVNTPSQTLNIHVLAAFTRIS